MSKRKLLFSVTKDDCRWEYYRGSGAGGQHRNKTDSCVRCTHKASGAVGQACENRSQHVNKRKAFVRMCESKEFKLWHRLECARLTGETERIEREVKRQMKNIKIEVKKDGLWTEVDRNAVLDENIIEVESNARDEARKGNKERNRKAE